MILFVRQFEYLSLSVRAAGIRILTHQRDVMPFPENSGVRVSPGFKTSVAMTKVRSGAIAQWAPTLGVNGRNKMHT